MKYTKETYLEELKKYRQLKEDANLNFNGEFKLKVLEDLENLILFGVGCSKPKEIPKTLTFEGRNYVSKQAIKDLIDNGDLILV